MGWEFRERWRSTSEHGVTRQISLSEIDEWFSKAWRVEWGQVGHLSSGGVSFTGDSREEDAREFLAAKQAELGGQWEHA